MKTRLACGEKHGRKRMATLGAVYDARARAASGRDLSSGGGAVADEAGDGAVGVGQTVAAVGPGRQLLPAFVVGEGVFDA
jgi:hypothetical protein